jgi:hypothetical protein
MLLLILPVGGCWSPCRDKCPNQAFLESFKVEKSGNTVNEYIDLTVYCDGTYQYRPIGEPNIVTGQLSQPLLDELKETVRNPFKFRHVKNIAQYRRSGDVWPHPVISQVYKYAQIEFLSDPNVIRRTLSVLRPVMSVDQVRGTIGILEKSTVLDSNQYSVWYYCPAGAQTREKFMGMLAIGMALAGTFGGEKPGSLPFDLGLYVELTDTKNIPLVLENGRYIGWGWDVYDKAVPHRREDLLKEFPPDLKKAVDPLLQTIPRSTLPLTPKI